MSELLRKSKKIYNQEGLTSLVEKSYRYGRNKISIGVRSAFDPIYIWLLPNSTTCQIGSHSAKFDLRAASLNGDFRYVLNSEKKVIKTLLQSLSSDDVFYDIGANVGVYTCFAGQVIEDGQIICFEPHPDALNFLNSNLHLNGIDAQTFQSALSETEGKAQINTSRIGAGHALAISETGDINTEQIPADKIKKRKQLRQPNVIKIDVEGFELGVIRGAQDLLGNEECREIFVEVHPGKSERYDFKTDEIYENLQNLGFKLSELNYRSVGGRTQIQLHGVK